MKKSREIVLLITSSLALSACDQKPPETRSLAYPLTATPTPTPSNVRTTSSSGGWWTRFGGGWSTGSSSGGEESGSVSRGGFGGHGSSAGE
ncbi:MAG TPA: hypothetical protein VNB29_02840 [Chthoniobacterales bacterium]|nr:hypothetical protein [Chthoniobacterales bacterium]